MLRTGRACEANFAEIPCGWLNANSTKYAELLSDRFRLPVESEIRSEQIIRSLAKCAAIENEVVHLLASAFTARRSRM
jgi:hypothetical protein